MLSQKNASTEKTYHMVPVECSAGKYNFVMYEEIVPSTPQPKAPIWLLERLSGIHLRTGRCKNRKGNIQLYIEKGVYRAFFSLSTDEVTKSPFLTLVWVDPGHQFAQCIIGERVYIEAVRTALVCNAAKREGENSSLLDEIVAHCRDLPAGMR